MVNTKNRKCPDKGALENIGLVPKLTQVSKGISFTEKFQWYKNILFLIQRGTPPSEATEKNNNQPHIVLFSDDDSDDEDKLQQFFICVEQNLMLECSNITSAIFFCIGAHYIFNLNYHPKSGKLFSSLPLGYSLIFSCFYQVMFG